MELYDVESLKGKYNNIICNFDRYCLIKKTPICTKEITIKIDFLNKEISGEMLGTENVVQMLKVDVRPYLDYLIEKDLLIRKPSFSL